MSVPNDNPDGNRIRQELLSRLKWNLFGDISDIRVLSLDENATESDYETPFLSHHIASEPIAVRPLQSLQVKLDDLEARDMFDYDDWDLKYRAPKPLVIPGLNEDGSVLTMKDFVCQLQPYLFAHKEEMLEAKAPGVLMSRPPPPRDLGDGRIAHDVVPGTAKLTLPEDTVFWYRPIFAAEVREGVGHLYITTLVNGCIGFEDLDDFWSRPRERARGMEMRYNGTKEERERLQKLVDES